MTAAYVRISRDDDKRNYSSIENQKLLIMQFAAQENLTIDRWYEDDGISGYLFDRPGFQQMLADLDGHTDNTILVKDLSRLGRHNARLLLLLDEFREQGRRLIAIDDHYDSSTSEDDLIGITTWFNERYVRDTSRKIRRALHARQIDGSLATQPPFGYKRAGHDKNQLVVQSSQAACITQIYQLYIQGFGYRKIAAFLTEHGIPTPSMARREQALADGRITNRPAAAAWSDAMVKEILDNDFYTGTLRLHKRARTSVHGKDKRIPKDQQYQFRRHHPAIIDPATFELVQEIKAKRTRSGYRGTHSAETGSCSPWNSSAGSWKNPAPFSGCLFCKDCGSKLTPIQRKTALGVRRYYICSTYNTKGKRYCAKAHLIEEQDLLRDITNYIRLCRTMITRTSIPPVPADETAASAIPAAEMTDTPSSKAYASLQTAFPDSVQSNRITQELDAAKKQLRTLLAQKIRDISANPDMESLIRESYDAVQQDITAQIDSLSKENNRLKQQDSHPDTQTIPAFLDDLIQKQVPDRQIIEILIDRIEIDAHGNPDIYLAYSLCGGQIPDDRHIPNDRQIPDGRQIPDDRHIPNDRQIPDGRQIPDDGHIPNDRHILNDRQILDDGQIPNGRQLPDERRQSPIQQPVPGSWLSALAAEQLNLSEHNILKTALQLFLETDRDFITPAYLADHLTKLGYQKTKRTVMPYIHMLTAFGILTPSDNRQKPYLIQKNLLNPIYIVP